MSAHWAVTEGEMSVPALARVGLGTLLGLTARRHPDRVLLVDPADKPHWSDRPAISWTYAAAAEIVERLARGLRGWRLAPGSRIGLHLAGSAESALALLAVEAAGHVPCLLPVAWDEARLLAAVQGTGLAAVLTQARIGEAAPAERICAVAVRYFGLRYVAAFGPEVPDGVINLDRIVLEQRAAGAGEHAPSPSPTSSPTSSPASSPTSSAVPDSGIVTFAGGDPERPVARSQGALVAAAAAHLVAARVAPGERILSLLGPHDLRGLATGLAAALVAGASLETLPLFDGAGFAAALGRDVPTHLVAPAFLEANLAGRALPGTLRSVSLAHRAPARFPNRSRRPETALRAEAVIDAVAFDETALLSGRRGSPRDVALTLARPERLGLPGTLMAMRHEPDGRLAFRGQACAAAPLLPGRPESGPAEAWRAAPYAPELSAGLATAVLAWGAPLPGPDADPLMNIFATA